MDPYTQRIIKETFKIWSPDDSVWSAWAKPVLFFNFKDNKITPSIKKINSITECKSNTAVIIDMPDILSISEGLYLASLGYRPVPLYNGVCESTAKMVVKVKEIQSALFGGAEMIEGFKIKKDAPPCFLLDSNRFKQKGIKRGFYDNRWRVFSQDMPSAEFLTKNGIERVVIRSEEIDIDILHVLYRYKEAGMKIFFCIGERGESIIEADLPRPNHYKSLFYRFKSLFDFKRNTAGGFGANVTEMKEGGYYGGGFYGGYHGGMG